MLYTFSYVEANYRSSYSILNQLQNVLIGKTLAKKFTFDYGKSNKVIWSQINAMDVMIH